MAKFWTAVNGGAFFEKGYGAAFALTFEAGTSAIVRGMAKEVQDYAQSEAPWEDRTGDARDGLTAQAKFSFTKYTIVLFHTVDYGIWLEVRWNGRYAIIMPTIETKGHELMGRLTMAECMKGGVRI
jgi:hypothetical protein